MNSAMFADLSRVTVTPASSGSVFLFCATWGDWVWQAAARASGRDISRMQDRDGSRAYLSFTSMRLRSHGGLTISGFDFGDRLLLRSRVSLDPPHGVVVRHVLTRDEGEGLAHGASIELLSYNRWIRRAGSGSNADVVLAAAPDLGNLPVEPVESSLRAGIRAIRGAEGFHVAASEQATEPVVVTGQAQPDPSVDINAAGLVYFAGMWRLADRAVKDVLMGLDPTAHLAGLSVVDADLMIFANFEVDATLRWVCEITDPGGKDARIPVEAAVSFWVCDTAKLVFSARFVLLRRQVNR